MKAANLDVEFDHYHVDDCPACGQNMDVLFDGLFKLCHHKAKRGETRPDFLGSLFFVPGDQVTKFNLAAPKEVIVSITYEVSIQMVISFN